MTMEDRMPKAGLSRRSVLKGAALAAAGIALPQLAMGGAGSAEAKAKMGPTGPSTTVAPYLLPSVDGVQTTALLTVADMPAANGYRMVGIPDGLGAFSEKGREFTLLMNHELGSTAGIPRAHGSKGAFVSKWTIDSKTFEVLSGEDLIKTMHLWTGAGYVEGTTALNRLCSADLAAEKAFRHGNVGTKARIFLNGEESDNGRAFAHVATGPDAGHTWELPRLGKMPFENVVASPGTRRKTVVIPLEDGDLSTSATGTRPCELYVYIGDKQSSGNDVERAGLTNGKLYGVKVYRADGTLVSEETDAFALGAGSFAGSARFELVEMGAAGDVSALSADQLQADAIAKGLLRMRRIEDGAWDPRGGRGDDFYFVTTADFATRSRLWRLRFNDVEDPAAGGSIEVLVNGGEVRMLDNLCVDGFGRVLMQEDPGNQDHIAKVWAYGIDSGELVEIAHHDPALFGVPAGPRFLTRDEESSGIIDAQDVLGAGWYLLDVQAHASLTDPELVQRGQLLAMYVHPGIAR